MKTLLATITLLASVSAFAGTSPEDTAKLWACAPEAASEAVIKSNLKNVEQVELNIGNESFETKVLENGNLLYDAHVYDSVTGNSESVFVLLNGSDCSVIK